jgi:alpha-1,2-mannosyltransferase
MSHALAGRHGQAARHAQTARRALTWPLAAAAVAFAVSVGGYAAGWATGSAALHVNPTDLQVYVDGGLIIRHVTPVYDGSLASPLYDWQSLIGLNFTYTPFAAVIFALVSFISWSVLAQLSAVVNVAALLGSLWLVLGPLGYRGTSRAALALLASAAALWLEPVQRTLFFGQVNLVLMLLVLVDLCVPDRAAGPWWRRTWWKGTGIGVAAGVKLVPLVFIPYLLLTRRFRQAAVAAGVFAATIAVGFAVTQKDSSAWWLHGLFYQGGRVGFPGVTQNQSLHGLIVRLAGSVAGGQPAWLATAAVAGITGICCAALLDRAGQPVLGILTCALTGLLISPVSWDHHWVWIAPGLLVMGHFVVRGWQAGRRRAATALCGLALVVWAVFGARPEGVWLPGTTGVELTGLLWAVPTTRETAYFQLGDQRWFPEYHWDGLQLVGGNLFVLVGIVLFALLIAIAASNYIWRYPCADSTEAGRWPRRFPLRHSPR